MALYHNTTGETDSPEMYNDGQPEYHEGDATEGWETPQNVAYGDPSSQQRGPVKTTTTATTTPKPGKQNNQKIALAIVGAAVLIGLFIYISKK
ncbi:hypothetical protein [uncultured Microscilla sp.]|uniref:hypothetical protein n=1 Tax=uncultured Microscilla sp. TaxID=432653 RepID=UPI002615AA6D|nr:hypothetical protein [uncultured Microscilla sp.]